MKIPSLTDIGYVPAYWRFDFYTFIPIMYSAFNCLVTNKDGNGELMTQSGTVDKKKKKEKRGEKKSMIIITFNNHSAHIVRFSNQFFNSKVNSIFTKNLVRDPLFFIATQPIFVFEKTSSVHFEDVFKTFLRHLQDVLPRHL